ncbi:hypothetical protein ABBQ32_003412 [Trebouxia sp. C0010 RCD-2024]
MGHTDVVTEAQQQLLVLCSHFSATVGSLQRDAPPLSVKGEPLLAAVRTPFSINEQTRTMAQQVIEASTRLEKLLLELPDTVQTEEQCLDRLKVLQQQHAQAGLDLAAALQEAQMLLAEVQDCFGGLADIMLL